jgi:hypothetical protein
MVNFTNGTLLAFLHYDPHYRPSQDLRLHCSVASVD